MNASCRTDLPHCYLKPGEIIIGGEPTMISTLLGSCVSVTMYSPRHRVGGICHGLLPSCKERRSSSCLGWCAEGTRFVECSIQIMLRQFGKLGITPTALEVKLFGGSDMFEARERRASVTTIGSQNVAAAKRVLRELGLDVDAEDIGGERGRKLFFHCHTGEVFLKHLRKSQLR